MALSTLTARIEEEDKAAFVSFCESVGLTSSAAINLFVKAANRERRTPSRSRSTTPSTAPPTRFTS